MKKRKPLIVLLCACISICNSFSQTASIIVGSGSFLTGGANAYVHIAGDIRNDGVVNTALLSIWDFDGSAQQRITCASGTGCTNIYNTDNYYVRLGSVYQNNAAGISVEVNTIIKGIHFFNSGTSEIKEGNYWLTQTSATPYSNNDNTSKFFITTGHGLLKQSNVSAGTLFPLGSAANTNNYTPITISYSGTADTFGVRVFDNVYFSYNTANGDALGGLSNYRFVKKTWIVKKSNRTTGDKFTITPQWNLVNEEANFTPQRPTNICIARNHNGFWIPETTQGPAIPPTGLGPFKYTGIVTYDNAPWEYYPTSVTAINIILPLTGLSFDGLYNTGKVYLNWSTLTETNTDHFEIERSINAVDFSVINTVPATGVSSTKQFYHYTDEQLPLRDAVLFYRLKMVDKNGHYTYSNVITVHKNPVSGNILVYPNPAKDIVNIIIADNSGKYVVQLYNVAGYMEKQEDASMQGNVITINCAELSSGIYFLKLINKENGSIVTAKINIAH